MVNTIHNCALAKSLDKIPASKVKNPIKGSVVSPTSSPHGITTSEELLSLRSRNEVLTKSLKAILDSADCVVKAKYDLVWYAKFRYRYAFHPASERIDKEREEDIKKLRSEEGDFYHGFNSGVLAAARMFKETADILHINEHRGLTPSLMVDAQSHSKKIEKAREEFPNFEVSSDFGHLK